jgi:SOS response regulatory protein OraA/RecX
MAVRITALVDVGSGRVRVDLDGAPWRTLPAEAVVQAGLRAGAEFDRPAARALRRALRQLEALDVAGRALERGDKSISALDTHLRRRGISSRERAHAVAVLERGRYLDDKRFATGRASALAARGYGNAAIAYDLERQGVNDECLRAALDGLPEEAERARVVVARSGATPKTARRLGARGFTGESIEAAFAGLDVDGTGADVD